MYNLLIKKGSGYAFLAGTAISLLSLLIIFLGLGKFETLDKQGQFASGIFDFGLWAAIILCVVSVVVALVMSVMKFGTSSSKNKTSLYGMVGLVALLVICIVAAPGQGQGSLQQTIEEFQLSPGIVKFIGGTLTASMIIGILSMVSLVFFEVRNMFK